MAGQVDVLLGGPGSGKSEQAERLAGSHRYVHLSTGALLRAEPSPEVQRQIAAGQLASSATTEAVLKKAMQAVDPALPILLDGFPRRVDEANWLEQALTDLGRSLGQVIYLDVPKEEATARLKKRGRSDDQPAAEAERWQEYERETRPVIDHYRHEHRLQEVDGVGEPSEVAARVSAAL